MTGRLGHVAQEVPEGKLALGDLYRLRTYMNRVALVERGAAHARRGGQQAKASAKGDYARGLRWWRHVLSHPISVPLAPRLEFPAIGDPGCAVLFTDAAREIGTGRGGFAPVWHTGDERPTFYHAEALWPEPLRLALMENEISMPAGELFGLIVMALALIEHLGSVTHLVMFTDSMATAAAVNTDASSSEQMNHLMRCFTPRIGAVQLLAIHIPGVKNGISDGLSRGEADAVLADARRSGFTTQRLRTHPDSLQWLDDARRFDPRQR